MEPIRISSLIEVRGDEEIRAIFEPLLSLDAQKLQIFVHGSWADATKTAFSDLDDFIIVEDDYYDIAWQALEQVAFNFQRKDPLQHHGHWLIKKSQLLNYDDSYMPLFIIQESICLMGDNLITANINRIQSINNTINRIKNTCKNILRFYDKYKEGILNVYDLKRFVGSVALMPPLVFQIKGKPLNKRQAILNSNSIFSTEALKLLQWSTECRNNWHLVVEHEDFSVFSSGLTNFDNAEKWREHASLNAPVLNIPTLSSIQLDDALIDLYISQTLMHVDEYKLQRKEVAEYEEAFQRITNFSVTHGAILVGQFGSIKYPTISDLDVLICFEDDQYRQGCKEVDGFIANDLSLSYFFTHSPLYVCKSMLHDIKFLHTLYDLNIVYNPLQIPLDIHIEKEYQEFLNIVWSYLILRTMETITSNIKLYDIRTLLLSLKNAQTTVVNLEAMLGIDSMELFCNHDTRILVLKEGIKSRQLIESEYFRVYEKAQKLLQELDGKIALANKKIRIHDVEYRVSEVTRVEREKKPTVIYLNKIFFNLILDVYKKRTTNSRIYVNTISKNYQLHKKIGGYINTYLHILPANSLVQNRQVKLYLKVKSYAYRAKKIIVKFISR